ncbi:MAG: phosphoglucosamine mutase [Chloroflexota bacterium]|nr:phosphoglucosamine mutase [Chloroflexota bacterium]
MTSGKLFGTDGIRGVAGQWPLTPEFVLRLGQAIGQVLCKDTFEAQVVIGRDTRLSGAMLESALTAGLLSAGVEAHHLGVIPTPGIAYLTRQWGMQAGIVISASHNPYTDNGIKLFGPDGFKLPDAMEAQIEDLVRGEEPLTEARGAELGRSLQRSEGERIYRQFLLGAWEEGSLEGMRIIFDCANGATSTLAPQLFQALGAECLVRHNDPDGLNINTSYEYLTPHSLAQAVIEEGADLGIAFDGDGDRVIFVDERGGFVNGDHTLAILAREMMAAETLARDTVIATVMSNMGLEVSLKEMGIRLERMPVGDRWVTERMREGGFTLGGEQAGHIVIFDQGLPCKEHTTGDGLYTALKLCQVLIRRQASLSELAACVSDFPQVLVNVPVRSKPPLEDQVAEAEDVLGEQGRIVLRYSGTEPVARVMIEGPEQELVEELAEGIAEVIRRELG